MGIGLTLNNKEERRAFVWNGVLDRRWSVEEASRVLGVGEPYIPFVLSADGVRANPSRRIAQTRPAM